MRGRVPLGVLAILGLCLTMCGPIAAQGGAAGADDKVQLQPDEGSPFAEESKQLQNAADAAARKAAFGAILAKADQLKRDPDPLLSILRNKKPEDYFKDLLEYVRDTQTARHASFVRPLVLAANDAGDNARVASDACAGYGAAALGDIAAMLQSEVAGERLAAATIAGRRIGGVAGAATLIPPLVNALERAETELSTVLMRSLSRLTLLNGMSSAQEWKDWLKGKTERDLIVEIADREAAARRKAEEERTRLEKELLEVLIDRMRKQQRDDPAALISHLKDSKYLTVRLEAVRLLKDVLKAAVTEEAARAPIDALGGVLVSATEPEELRKLCANALAESGKPALAFPYIDQCIAANGISSDLRLELVRGLNSPIAAKRLSELLKTEIDGVEDRSGALLETLITQVRSVIADRDQGEAAGAILHELDRLLGISAAKLTGSLEAPARKRWSDLSGRACDTLAYLARLRNVDIAVATSSLVSLACVESSGPDLERVPQGALSALREAVLKARGGEVASALSQPPLSEKLSALYSRLLGGPEGSGQVLIRLIQVYQEMGTSPEPVTELQRRLLERARSVEATLPDSPDDPRTLRDALRTWLARLLATTEQHAALLAELVNTEYGDRDALGYLQALKAPRVAVINAAFQALVESRPIRVATILVGLEQSRGWTSEEGAMREYKVFRDGLMSAVRAEYGRQISGVLSNGVNDDERAKLNRGATGPLRELWTLAALEKLREKADPSANRDAVSEILLSSLKQAHPGRYDNFALNGGTKESFLKALDDIAKQMKNDGYAVP